MLQEEKTLVKENNKMPNKRRWVAYDDGSGLKLQVSYRGSPWGGLGTVIQTVFSFGFLFYFFTEDVSLRTGPPSSSRVASISASSSCRVNYT